MTNYKVGDLVKVKEALELLPSLEKYIGDTGRVFHAETVMSPYSGQISQVLGIRFPNHARHITENASWFVEVA